MDRKSSILVEAQFESKLASSCQNHTQPPRQNLEEVSWSWPRWLHDWFLRVWRKCWDEKRQHFKSWDAKIHPMERDQRDSSTWWQTRRLYYHAFDLQPWNERALHSLRINGCWLYFEASQLMSKSFKRSRAPINWRIKGKDSERASNWISWRSSEENFCKLNVLNIILVIIITNPI